MAKLDSSIRPMVPWWLGWILAVLLFLTLALLPATSWVVRLHWKQLRASPDRTVEDRGMLAGYPNTFLRGGHLLLPSSWLPTSHWRMVDGLSDGTPISEQRALFDRLQPPTLGTAAHLRWLWSQPSRTLAPDRTPSDDTELLLAREGFAQEPENAFFFLAAFRAAVGLERWSEAAQMLERASQAKYFTSYGRELHALLQTEMEQAHGFLGADYRHELTWITPRDSGFAGTLVPFTEAPGIDLPKARIQMARAGEVLVRTADSEEGVRAGVQLLRVAAFGGSVPRGADPDTVRQRLANQVGFQTDLPAESLSSRLPSTLDEDTGFFSGTELGTVAFFTILVFVSAGILALGARKWLRNDLAFALLPLLWPVGPSLGNASLAGAEHHRAAALAVLLATGLLIGLASLRSNWSFLAKLAITVTVLVTGAATYGVENRLAGLGGLLISAALLSSSLFVTDKARASRFRTVASGIGLLAVVLLTALTALEAFDLRTSAFWIPTLLALAPLLDRIGFTLRSLGFASLCAVALYAATMPIALEGNARLQQAADREVASGDYVRARLGLAVSGPGRF